MFGTVSSEMEVKAPASEAWKLYSTLELAKVVAEALPNQITKIDVVQGDGGAGTILELFFPPVAVKFKQFLLNPSQMFKEKFTVVDDEKLVKETEVVEGGFLDLGFTLYRVRFEVVEKAAAAAEECITRATVEYEVREECIANAAFVSIQPLVDVMECAARYLTKTSS